MPFDHTRPLNRGDYRTLALAALGGTLEFYDFVIYVFFAAIMGHVFFPPHSPEWLVQLQTYGIFAAGYLARPLGGIVMAHFGDLHGRKRMFTLSILLMALPTFIMGLLPTYADIGIWAPVLLLALRVLQGAAIGGEIPGAWVFVSEHVPARRVGFACGTLTAGLTLGILLGSLVASAMHARFSEAELVARAWRIPFLLGGVFGLLAVYLRGYLQETPIFKELAEQRALLAEWPMKRVLASHRGAMLLSMLATWLLTGGIVVVILMTPSLLGKLPGIGAEKALLANSLAVVCLSIGCVLAGSLTDRFGNGPTLFAGSGFLLVACYGFYSQIAAHPDWLFPGYALLGLTVGVIAAVPCIMVRAFPATVRFSGLSLSYNLAYAIFGGLTPMAVALMLKSDPQAPAHYVEVLALMGMVLGLALCARRRQAEPDGLKAT
ncbi:putative MFS family arabinose efflux permease [Paludibacterium purpuratum]|uniref:Putative MFS family arabinose efflux permease n=2 Tax=Paludibacterium purpuratum TaxID=1144873 RepID=A0A4R7BDA5_9NEIS|nr:putative MFS family arabinose efflux permease [Paludibacterium purpuratum]